MSNFAHNVTKKRKENKIMAEKNAKNTVNNDKDKVIDGNFSEVNESGNPIVNENGNVNNGNDEAEPVVKVTLWDVWKAWKACNPKKVAFFRGLLGIAALAVAYGVGSAVQEKKDDEELNKRIEDGELILAEDIDYEDDEDEDQDD